MISHVLSGAVIALGIAVATATPAGADPSVFGVLSCGCEGAVGVSDGAPVPDQVNTGIQNGISDLQGVSG